ncbi:hypothetical protein VIOR3934_16907 [Vibrio orientalis CIP 102891 = ATCC 33934]|uniref:DUF2986 domain-containing protein n=2 Tax=Vibrio orientalis CIP 102891 = ATCC 33934 TaxID=675816 RepID=F9SUB3_VIBOR|nr:hypothetical protein VIOR3934_16907 [Vibrio orientalis CIP 102891 = ATCC 33934]
MLAFFHSPKLIQLGSTCVVHFFLIGFAANLALSDIMNRKKKINSILKAKQKKMNAKLHKSNKPRYISKAERAKLEAEEASSSNQESPIEQQSVTNEEENLD